MRVLALLVASFSVALAAEDTVWNRFQNFIKKFDKVYKNIETLETRFQNYKENMEFVNAHNAFASNYTYTLGETIFADLSLEEFRAQKNAYLTGGHCSAFVSEGASPSSIDWRTKGAVTPVKDQGQCGSCWSFSATGAMEGAWQIATGDLVSLSEQQLVDCSAGFKYGNHGCNGGLMDGAFQYAIDNGMCTEAEYSYQARSGTCEECDAVVEISSCVDVTPENEVALENAVSQGPVSVAIEADTRTFQLYTGGVLTSDACGTNLDHGVLVVGYGTEGAQDYWLVKNSWGTSWGEDGYIKLGKTSSTHNKGVCGIAMEPSYPVV
jgi:KDEL-tailed cysteine endopeptidase